MISVGPVSPKTFVCTASGTEARIVVPALGLESMVMLPFHSARVDIFFTNYSRFAP